jgi:hypothetical protein
MRGESPLDSLSKLRDEVRRELKGKEVTSVGPTSAVLGRLQEDLSAPRFCLWRYSGAGCDYACGLRRKDGKGRVRR